MLLHPGLHCYIDLAVDTSGKDRPLSFQCKLQTPDRRQTMTDLRRILRRTLCVSIASLALSAQAAYPEKSIRMVVPYPPGGSTDVVARALAAAMTERLK